MDPTHSTNAALLRAWRGGDLNFRTNSRVTNLGLKSRWPETLPANPAHILVSWRLEAGYKSRVRWPTCTHALALTEMNNF